MVIDGVFASQAIDSSGEILDVSGCDISTLDKDGVANYEHKQPEDKNDKGGSKANNGEEICGKIVYATKVFTESDCENDRQKMYFNKIGRIPFIYGIVRLYDGAGHDGARALAAQIRDHHANNDPILVRFSIEGNTMERSGQRLTACIARRVALTLKPCNRTAVSGLIEDPKAPTGFDKTPVKASGRVKDLLASLMDDHRDEEDVQKREHTHPMYTKLGGVHEVESAPLIKDDADVLQAIKLIAKAKMLKALTAGGYNVAPGSLSGGAALQREDLKGRALAALRDYGKSKFDKSEFRTFVKNRLPEASDEFVDHFADLAEDYHVKLKKAIELTQERLAKDDDQVAAPAPAADKPKPKKSAKPKATAAAPAPVEEPKAPAAKPKKGKAVPMAGPALPKESFKQPSPAAVGDAPAAAPEADQVHWDPATGTLHTAKGSYKAFNDSEHWDGLLANPDFVDKFDAVMNNWKIVHGLRQKGITIPGETAIAAMMGGYSANELVPVQEMAIQHTLETVEPTDLETAPPTADQESALRGAFTGKKWPETNQEWFHNHDTDVNTTAADRKKHEGKPVSQVPTRLIGKPEDKIGTLNFYHRLHPFLHELMKKHGMNGSKIVEELIKAKGDFNAWKQKTGTKENKQHKPHMQQFEMKLRQELGIEKLTSDLKAKGLDDEQIKKQMKPHMTKLIQGLDAERERIGWWGTKLEHKLAYAGPIVEHLSNKTIRYMIGMLGYGESHVPDTHFVRHYFGLDPNNNEHGKVSGHLKDVLLDPKNAHILQQIDDHYRQNHPAAKWTQQRYFDGKQDVHSTFPAFWAHWLNIVPHERARGLRAGEGRGGTANEQSTHAPYWWAVAQQMKKHGIPGWEKMIFKMLHEMAHLPMQARVANALHELHDQYGTTGATIAYYHSMVPALLNSQGKDHGTMIRKMENWTIELRKAAAEIRQARESKPAEKKTYFAGKQVMPGHATTATGDYHLLHENRTHYIAVPVGTDDHLDAMVKFPKEQEGTHYTVVSRPSIHVSDLE